MQYLRRFAVTGSLCPSTRFFGERAAFEVARQSHRFDRTIVAGVGNGVVANRIFRNCPDAIFVECEDRFIEHFSRRHPKACLIHDRVERLFEHRPELRDQRLLLASFIPTAGSFYNDELARLFVQICRSGGSVIQMRYLPHRMSARFFERLTDRGIVSVETRGYNQHGDEVLYFRRKVMVPKKGTAPEQPDRPEPKAEG